MATGTPPEGRRPQRGWPALPARSPGARAARGTGNTDPPSARRRASARDALPPWRQVLRDRARGEDAEQPRRTPPWREPARSAPRGANAARERAASARRRAPLPPRGPARPRNGARRVSTGPRRLVRARGANHHLRVVVVRFVLIAALVAAGIKLIQVQGFEAEALAAKAEEQRETEIDIPASRGSILDRNGVELAFSVESRELAYRPKAERAAIAKANAENPKVKLSFEERTAEIARGLRALIGDRVTEADLLAKLRKDAKFVYLVDNVEPAVAREIQERFPEIISEYRAVREYPGGPLASNIVGVADWRMDNPDVEKHNLHGLSGLESKFDTELSGKPGRRVADTKGGSESLVIPGTGRDLEPATNGSNIELTIDADLQYHLQQSLAEYVALAEARGGSAVVLDARTGEVYAMANDKSFDPTAPRPDLAAMGNPAVSNPYEPGSVNKVVTALCSIEHDLTEPDDVHQVDGQRRVADRIVEDAWGHGTLPFTTTGIFAKSSNVGTLMLAEECGEDRFSELLDRLGIGARTGIELPGESAGQLPPREHWSGSTFGNLPIGQGLSMTVLQMAGMYQAVANDGVRVPPRIIRAIVDADGERVTPPRPKGVRVVSQETARTVRDMFRAVTQDGDGLNDGTGVPAALTGYQISGKTGTAQQVDPETKIYSKTLYWVTFAGILPADDPRFVVGIVLDRPNYTGGELEGRSAAPLFHDIASYLAQRYRIPLSKKATPVVPLIAE